MNAETTIQRLTDLSEVSASKEITVLAKIMRDYVEAEKKVDLGFKHKIEEKEASK